MEKTFMTKQVIQIYKDMKKLKKYQQSNEDHSTGYLLDYDSIKNHYKLIAVDLSRQKIIKCRSKSNSTNSFH